MSLSQAWLDELRARTTLSTLIGKSVKVTRAGREFKACCPFHNEKTPSFTINDEGKNGRGGFYHCFGCGAHGDAIRWMTDHGGLPFIDAVKELAAAAGMDVPAPSPEAAARAARIDGVRPALEAACLFYQQRLAAFADASRDPPSPSAGASGGSGGDTTQGADNPLVYLAARGIGPDMIARFGLGWAPPGRDHVRQIPGMTFDAARDAGLVWTDDATGQSGAFFRSRVMIPVHDGRGQVVGFAGRSISDETRPGPSPGAGASGPGAGGKQAGGAQGPKYKNSPATEIFDKGRLLFNLHRAQSVLRDLRSQSRDTPSPSAGASGASGGAHAQRRGKLVIVEGQIDAMMLDMTGLAAVAPMGTALTASQMEAAWRIDSQPILLFDGDAAGVKAARRACDLALPLMSATRSLRIAVLADGDDPDSLLRRAGSGAVRDILFQSQPVDRWLFNHLASAVDRGDAAGVAAVAHELSDLAGRMTDPMLQREYEAGWQVRHLRELSAAGVLMRVEPDPPHGIATPDKSAADAAATLAAADDEGERQLRQGIEAWLGKLDDRDGINDDIASIRSILKSLGYDVKALGRTIADLRADRKNGGAGAREETEAIWATYRRVMGISGPVFEATMPAITAERRERAATIAGKRMRRVAAELAMPRLAAPLARLSDARENGDG